MNIEKYCVTSEAVPQQIKLYKEMIIDEEAMRDYRLTLAPSVLPFGDIKLSALDGENNIWYIASEDNSLMRANLFEGKNENVDALIENKNAHLIYYENGCLWVLCAEDVFKIDVKSIEEVPTLGENPRQKIPYYYRLGDERVGENIRAAVDASKEFTANDFIKAIGAVVAVCDDGDGGYFAALENCVLHFSPKADFDCRTIELYHGGRFIFGNDNSLEGIAWVDNCLWTKNALGFVKIEHKRMALSEKEKHFDRLAWELHSVRGSLCDTSYVTEDFGNGGVYEQTVRYSTNNDALWSVFHSIGDALKLSYLKKSGDIEEYEKTREKLITVTKNVLLQSHVHGLGNGFVCRSYISVKDGIFTKDGKPDVNGLWYEKSGKNADGSRCVVCADTLLGRSGFDPEEGKNFKLTDEVKKQQNTDAVFPVTDDFRLTAPIVAEVPPLLAEMYKKPDPYRPEKYPASEDSDLVFKADTSSEEAIAAFVQYYFVWKHLISQSDREEDRELGELICETALLTINHIIDNGYCLRDLHGNPTQWGKWFADYFVKWENINEPWRHPFYAFTDGALNGAEIMCMFKVCMYIFKDNPKYKAAYDRVSAEYEKAFTMDFDGVTNGAGYASLVGQYREKIAYNVKAMTGIDNYTLGINYSDETLAIIAFWPLLELEENHDRRAILAAGFDEWWDNMRREGNPIYTFAYAAMNPEKNIDLNEAVDYLNRLPLYPNRLPVKNSERNDLIMILSKKGGVSNRLLPIDERRTHKFNGSPFEVDTEGEKGEEMYKGGYLYSGNIFTWPYWTAKYYNIVNLD